jgi:hypothetical protein
MVQPSYLLQKSAGPSPARILFDQRIVPGAINAAGAAEALIERLAVYTRKSPLSALAVGLAVGGALGCLAARRKR